MRSWQEVAYLSRGDAGWKPIIHICTEIDSLHRTLRSDSPQPTIRTPNPNQNWRHKRDTKLLSQQDVNIGCRPTRSNAAWERESAEESVRATNGLPITVIDYATPSSSRVKPGWMTIKNVNRSLSKSIATLRSYGAQAAFSKIVKNSFETNFSS